MKFSTKSIIFLSCLFPLCILFSSEYVMDTCLVPRFLWLGVGLILGGGLFLRDFLQKKQFQFSMVDWTVLIYAALNIFSISRAINIAEAVFETEKILLFLMIYGIVRFLYDSEGEAVVKKIYLLNAVSTFLVLSVGLNQLFGLDIYSSPNTYKITSLCAHRNLFGGYLLMLIPFNAAGYIRMKGLWRLMFGGLLLTQFFFFIILQSESIIYALAVALLVMSFIYIGVKIFGEGVSFKKYIAYPLVLLALVISGFATGFIQNKAWEYANSETGGERLFQWYRTGQLLQQEGLMGVGNGNWQIVIPGQSLKGSYRQQVLEVVATRPHNDFVWILSELGILGLTTWLLLLGIIFTYMVQIMKKNIGKPVFWETLFVAGGLSAYLTFSFFDFPRERIEHQILLFLIFAWVVYQRQPMPVLNRFFKTNALYLAVFSLPIVIFSLWTGYHRYEGEHHIKLAQQGTAAANATNPNNPRIKEIWKLCAEEAQKSYSYWFTVDPTAFPVKWQEGYAAYRYGDLPRAYKCFAEAYKANPFNYHVLNNYGTTLVSEGKRQEALEFYEKAYFINPKFEGSLFNMVGTYIDLNELDKAEEYLQKAKIDTIQKTRFQKIIFEKKQGK